MFGFSDMPKFLFSFLLVLPLVSLVHQLGHSITAIFFGGRVDFTIGKGKTIFKWKKIKIKSVYFLDSFCVYEKLKYDNRFTHACVYAGGAIANLASIFLINGLVMDDILSASLFFLPVCLFFCLLYCLLATADQIYRNKFKRWTCYL